MEPARRSQFSTQGYDPTILPDLQQFDRTFNLPDPPSFQQINNQNATLIPAVIGETSLDVEWAHAIAPVANILLFDFAPRQSPPFYQYHV